MAKVPVVILFYNRPALLAKVLVAVREYRPTTLFLVSDGPKANNPTDASKVDAARAVVEIIDWPCVVLRKYEKQNLGSRFGVSKGLTWVFNHTDKAIILEDDCVAHSSFFLFCEELLDRFEADSSVMAICGYNPWGGPDPAKYSYGFSRYPHPWGWATWKRAWCRFDDSRFLSWAEVRDSVYETSEQSNVRGFWKWVTRSGPKSAWDYQWVLTCLMNQGRCIVPSQNLISNQGFGEDATHTKTLVRPAESYAIEFPLKHNQVEEFNGHYERAIENAHFRLTLRLILIPYLGPLITPLRKIRNMLSAARTN